jgi:hypothetical protein
MKATTLALVLAFAAGPAFAHSCPKHMRAIDAALPKAKLSASQMAEVKKRRAEGETLHKQGKHDVSMAALGKAEGILGIK